MAGERSLTLRERLPTTRDTFVLMALLAIAAAVVTRSPVAALPFVVLALSPVAVPTGTMRVYRPETTSLAVRLLNGLEVDEDEEHVIDARVGVNLGAVAAVVAAVYYASLYPMEAITVFVATLPVAYLSSKPVTGVGVYRSPLVGVVPVLVALTLGRPEAALAGVPGLMVATAAYLSSSELKEESSPRFSIGGRGGFEAVFLTTVLTVAMLAVPLT